MVRFKLLTICAVLTLLSGAASAATISGSVTERGTGLPVEGAVVRFTDPGFYFGIWLAEAVTDVNGDYTLTFTVDAANAPQPEFDGNPAVSGGEVLLEVVAASYQPQRFGASASVVDCFSFCEFGEDGPELAGLFTVADADALVRDFQLDPGSRIAGTIEAAGGGALEFVPVTIFTPEREELRAFAVESDAAGQYATPFALPAGTFFAGAGAGNFNLDEALPYGNFVSQVHDGFDCEFLSCAITQSSPVVVPATMGVLGGIDFHLNPGGSIEGQILYADTGLPLSNPDYSFVRVWTPDDGRLLAQIVVFSDRFGPGFDSSYRIEGLSGSYILEIDPVPSLQTDLVRVLNDGTNCPFAACNRGVAVPYVIGPGTALTQDFSLERGGRITGQVTDSGGAPLAGSGSLDVYFGILDASGNVLGGAVLDGTGTIVSADGVRPGDYFVTTGLRFTNRSLSGQGSADLIGPKVDQLFSGVACQGLACDLTDPGATLVSLTAGATTAGIDFMLTEGATIAGTVTGGGAPLEGRTIEIYTTDGRLVAVEFTASDGSYETGGLPDGTYRVVVKDGGRPALGFFGIDGLGYLGKVFGAAGDCNQARCNAAAGSDVTISAGANVAGIDVDLTAAPTISGQVIDTLRGLPILLTVDVLDSSGNAIGAWSTVTSDDATYTTGGLLPGTYTLVPRTTRAYSVGSPPTIVKGEAVPGTLTIELGSESVTGASLGVYQDLVFFADFERR